MKSLKENNLFDINNWVDDWHKKSELWTIHVDELIQWSPKSESFNEWVEQLLNIYNLACSKLSRSDVLVATLSFEATKDIQKFSSIKDMRVDYFSPPTLYLLEKFDFPFQGEMYYRILHTSEFDYFLSKGLVIAFSGRSVQEKDNLWDFNNTLYFVSNWD